MSKFSFRLPALALGVLVCGALAMAQGGGARQGGRGFGGFGGRGGNEFGLLRRSDVQRDLQLTSEQKTKLEDLLESQRGERGDRGGRRRNGDGQANGQEQRNRPTEAEREARRAQAEARRLEMQKKLAEVLNATQVSRLHEISIQLRGSMALLDPSVQQSVGLSTDQVAKIKDLQEKMRDASRSVMEKAQGQEITREQVREAMQKNTTIMKDELAKLLSAEQAAKLKALGGAPFKADPDEDGGR